ncbi:MAG: gliding motility protein GldL [Bacteroidales bacterium]|nr:gliding motility protein GldL [Bacteroidales bacterium]
MSFIDNLVRSKGYKSFMGKLYGVGASVVIVGAMFKIMHWPGADLMIVVGMSTEAIIFFFSAFEPLHVEYDWSLVYPELAGVKEGEGEAGGLQMQLDEDGNPVLDEDGNPIMIQAEPSHAHGDGAHIEGGGLNIQGGGTLVINQDPVSQQLDKMLDEAKIGPELIESLGKGMQKLAETTNTISEATSVVAANENLMKNIDGAAESANSLSEAYRRTAENVSVNAGVSEEYLKSIQDATSAVDNLSSIYRETAQSLSSEDVSYADELKKMASSLSSINAMYEMQLQNSSTQLQATKEVQDRIQDLVVNFANSADDVLRYKEQVDALSRKVAELNQVYGNMLAAMQTRI